MRPYRVLCLIALAVLMGVVILPQTASADTIFVVGSPTYTNNGVEKGMNVAPYVHDGRTFLPIAFVADALGIFGSDVIWDEAAQTVTLVKGDKIVQMKIGSTTMLVNGAAITLDAPPEVQGGRTCLPVALVIKSFDYSINWDSATQSITISGGENGGRSNNNSSTTEEKTNNNPGINNNTNSIDLTSLNYYGTDAGASLHIDQLYGKPLEMAGNEYNKGILINDNYSKATSKYVAYKLDSAYTRLTGILGMRIKGISGKYTDKLIIYGDDRVLYESPYFTKTDAPLNVDIDITGVDVLKFDFCGNGDSQWGYPVFAKPVLSGSGNSAAQPQPTNIGPTDLTSLNYYGTDAGSSLHIDQLYDNPLEMAGNEYNKGILINDNYSKAASKYVAYKLDSAYTRLTGILGMRIKGISGKYTDKLIIYGDDRVLYESSYFTKTDAPLDVDIDITGVDVLKFYFCGNGDAQWGYPVFANPILNGAQPKLTNTGPIDITSLSYYGTDAGSSLHIDQLYDKPLEMAGNQYDKGFVINDNYSKENSKYVAYKLDSAYTRLTGILGIRVKGISGKYTDKMIIYGDDRVLYESPYFTKTDAPQDVDIDITGVDVLKFYFCGNGDAQWGYPVFANPRLN